LSEFVTEPSSEHLVFTGERFLPERGGEIWYEHWHRYALARQLSKRCAVLDVACGEGYGAATVAEVAGSVLGVDLSGDAIQHARKRYGHHDNLQFLAASCERLPLADASFDLAISFETIEHIHAQKAFVSELARVLRPDGILILSSPNKRLYSDAHDYHNEFHVRELYRDELAELLLGAFPHIAWYCQKLLFHSAIWPEIRASETTEYLLSDDHGINDRAHPAAEPMYYIAVCCRNPSMLPAAINKLSLFSDSAETVYRDYINQTRRVLDLDRLLINRENLVAERDAALSLRTLQMEEREGLIVERDFQLTQRDQQIIERDALLEQSAKQNEQQLRQIAERDALLTAIAEQNEEHLKQIAERDALLALRTDQMEAHIRQIAGRDALLALRTAQMEEHLRQIAERDGLLSLRTGQMEACVRQIAERDALLMLRTEQMETHVRQIAERDALLALRTEQMETHVRQIAERDALLSMRAGQMKEREDLIVERDARIAQLLAQAAEQERLIVEFNRQLAYRASWVWWLKSPLRLTMRTLRAND
jgi:ubiquinone/menaquinone biosynthesis C-methylase UbiE/uncharacterized coiled-coil protein SlyX